MAMALLALPAIAEDGSLAARLQVCASLDVAEARLRCFDALAAGVAEQTTRSSGATVPTVAPQASETAPGAEDRFGREQALVSEASSGPGALAEIRTRIAELRRQGDGRLVFELDNGQVWLQAEPPSQSLQVKAGDAVVIRRAAMGSFLLVTEQRRSTRVRRTR